MGEYDGLKSVYEMNLVFVTKFYVTFEHVIAVISSPITNGLETSSIGLSADSFRNVYMELGFNQI